MPGERADVLVIGGGIVGLSVAWQLRQLGVGRIVVLEADTPGSGSTGRAAGGIRRQFGSRLEIEMTLASLDFFGRLLADPEFPSQLEAIGYAFLAGPNERATLEQSWAIQQELGIPSEWLEANDVAARFPYLETTGLDGLLVVAGFNGHGIMHGPAAARALAELIARGRADSLDLDRLRPSHFDGPASEHRLQAPTLL